MTLEERITRLAEDSYRKGAIDFSESVKEALHKLVEMGMHQTFSPSEIIAMIESAEQEIERLHKGQEGSP